MKAGIHPKTQQVSISCSCGNSFTSLSTLGSKELKVESCHKCHPFYTGENRILKTSSVDKFYARQKRSQEKAGQ